MFDCKQEGGPSILSVRHWQIALGLQVEQAGQHLHGLEGAQANVSKELCRRRACKEDKGLVVVVVLLSYQVCIVPEWH